VVTLNGIRLGAAVAFPLTSDPGEEHQRPAFVLGEPGPERTSGPDCQVRRSL